MKNLGKTKLCLGLQFEYTNNKILVHQMAYTEKVLKRYDKEQIRVHGPMREDEEVLGPEMSYLSVVGVLMYLASYTRPDTCFVVYLLSKLSSYLT